MQSSRTALPLSYLLLPLIFCIRSSQPATGLPTTSPRAYGLRLSLAKPKRPSVGIALSSWLSTELQLMLCSYSLFINTPISMNHRHGKTDLFKNRKGVCVKAVHCHSAYLTSMQSTSCEMLGWMNHKLESRLLGEISTTSDLQIPL